MNERDIENMLTKVIKNEISSISNLSDKDEYADAIDNLVKLYKLKIEDDKIAQNDNCKKLEERFNEKKLAEQIKLDEKKLAEQIKLEEKKLAEQDKRTAEQIKFDEKKLAEQIKLDEKKLAEQIKLEKNKLAEQMSFEETKLNRQIEFEEKKLAEQIKFEEKKLTEQIKLEEKLEKKKMAEQIKDRYFKIGIAAAELFVPLMFYGMWLKMGFKFEEEGTFTSSTFRGLFRYFKPVKK